MSPDRLRGADAACKCLNRLAWAELPVDPLAICKRLKRMVMLRSYEEIGQADSEAGAVLRGTASGSEGQTFTARTEDGRHEMVFILYREGGHPGRVRYTVAHELGHVALGHREDTPANDAQAEAFAAALLCPPGFPALLERALGAPLTPEGLASVCGISREAARLALKAPAALADLPAAREAAARLVPAGVERAGRFAESVLAFPRR